MVAKDYFRLARRADLCTIFHSPYSKKKVSIYEKVTTWIQYTLLHMKGHNKVCIANLLVLGLF